MGGGGGGGGGGGEVGVIQRRGMLESGLSSLSASLLLINTLLVKTQDP